MTTPEEDTFKALCDFWDVLGMDDRTNLTPSQMLSRLLSLESDWREIDHLKREVCQLNHKIEGLLAQRDLLLSDIEEAAGELMIPIPEPGSDASKLMAANAIMRRQRDRARKTARKRGVTDDLPTNMSEEKSTPPRSKS